MSNITINDKSGGKYETTIEFTYGECERLPFNILRRLGAKLKVVPDGGLMASASFNIRNSKEAGLFVELLDMFGGDGSYRHGSAADPAALALTSPPKGEEGAVEMDDDLELEGSLDDL